MWTRSEWFYDPQDEYDGKLSSFNFTVAQSGGGGTPAVTADPKHRFVTALNWELPVGQGHALGPSFSRRWTMSSVDGKSPVSTLTPPVRR